MDGWMDGLMVAIIILAAVLGVCVFVMVGSAMIGFDFGEDVYQVLESAVSERQVERSAEKMHLLSYIRTVDECKRQPLWERYHLLDAKDQAFAERERDQLVAASGFTITEHEQYELEHGVNPYR